MPGPTPTLSRCAPTTMTLSGSPCWVSAITFDVSYVPGRQSTFARAVTPGRALLDAVGQRHRRVERDRPSTGCRCPSTLIQTGPSAAKKSDRAAPPAAARRRTSCRGCTRCRRCRSTIAPCRHPVVVRRLAPARVGRGGGRVQVEVGRPHRRGRRRPTATSTWCRSRRRSRLPAIPGHEGAIGAAGHDVQDRRRVVGEQVEVVLEVLPADVEARGRGPLGHVVRRRVVARRPREAVAAGEVGDVLQCGLVLHDPRDGHRLAELLRRVVVAVLAIRPCGPREHEYAGDRQREAAPHASPLAVVAAPTGGPAPAPSPRAGHRVKGLALTSALAVGKPAPCAAFPTLTAGGAPRPPAWARGRPGGG